MKTFAQSLSDYKTLSNDSSSANEALGISLLNSFTRRILMMRDWTFNRGSLRIHASSGDWKERFKNGRSENKN
jgi:hypothetical protein